MIKKKSKPDFITQISGMDATQINNYIKTHGKPPKKVRMYHVVNKKKTINR